VKSRNSGQCNETLLVMTVLPSLDKKWGYQIFFSALFARTLFVPPIFQFVVPFLAKSNCMLRISLVCLPYWKSLEWDVVCFRKWSPWSLFHYGSGLTLVTVAVQCTI